MRIASLFILLTFILSSGLNAATVIFTDFTGVNRPTSGTDFLTGTVLYDWTVVYNTDPDSPHLVGALLDIDIDTAVVDFVALLNVQNPDDAVLTIIDFQPNADPTPTSGGGYLTHGAALDFVLGEDSWGADTADDEITDSESALGRISFSLASPAVPEPSTFVLASGAVLACLLCFGRRRRVR